MCDGPLFSTSNMPRRGGLPDPSAMSESSKRRKRGREGGASFIMREEDQQSFDVRCREAIGDAFQMCDEIPASLFSAVDFDGNHEQKTPKYGRTVTWIPRHSKTFLLYYREHVERKRVEHETGGMAFATMLNQQTQINYKPETFVYVPDFGIPMHGTSSMSLMRGDSKAPSNTCLVCAYSDDLQYADEPGYNKAATGVGFRVYVFDVLMFNGVVLSDHHPVDRHARLRELHEIGCLPPHFRVQEIMEQVRIKNASKFISFTDEELDPWVPMAIVELSMFPACPIFYSFSR
jgi:hypothetical protein